MKKIRALQNTLIVLPDPDETQSAGGIIYPDVSRKKLTTGTVLLHGPGELEDLTDKRIVFEKWNWRVLLLDRQEFYVVPERAVLAVFDGRKVEP